MIISVPQFGENPSNTLGREPAEVSSGPESIFERIIKELLICTRSKSELATALGLQVFSENHQAWCQREGKRSYVIF